MKRSCDTCLYWFFYPRIDGKGECRRYAPRAHFEAIKGVYMGPLWPATDAEFWCGDFVAKPKELTDYEILLTTSVQELDVPARVFTAIRNEDITTLGELIKMTPWEWKRLPNFGNRSLLELKRALWDQFKLRMKGDDDSDHPAGDLRPSDKCLD